MNPHALEALEFGRVLDLVAGHATSALGAAAVRDRRPITDRDGVSDELGRVHEVVGWLIREEKWAPPTFPDLTRPLERLEVEGAVWSEAELVGALRLLEAARSVRRSVLPRSGDFPQLTGLVQDLIKEPELRDRLGSALDEESETLNDDASPELKRLRASIRSSRADLISQLERIVDRLPDHVAVPDASVTLRNGRYCIPVRREGRSDLGGIVHDESASRATVFVEPPSAIEMMNRLRELEMAEVREVERILRELTGALRPHGPALRDALRRLVRLDSLFARARYALLRGCARPELVRRDSSGYRVVNARHPLLLEGSGATVPFDLLLNPGEHTVLVSGPNAGGKTVLLKTIGLISAMTQAGFLPPVGEGSEVPVFGAIFADIGDEQSIEASLSTFTAHLRNLKELLEQADAESLCLIDEIGGATDPVEGTALGRAVLIELTRRHAMTVATSHLTGLRTLPEEQAGVVNAGLSFDPERLEPLYRLVKGRPGRSYGLAIARRIGFPDPVVGAAESMLDAGEVDAGRLLEELELKETELTERLDDVRVKSAELEKLDAALNERAAELERREKELEEEAHRKARDYLLDARAKVNEALKADRAASREARSALEADLRRHTEALRADDRDRTAPVGDHVDLEVGDRVRVISLERTGRVVELRDGEALVEIGDVKLSRPLGDLEPSDNQGGPSTPVATYSGPDDTARTEVDLRGLVAEEARAELVRALDAAVQAGLPSLRVIHGKGTGVLREMVAEYVRSDSRVRSFRLGAPHEGGTGVTELELS